MIAQRGVRTMAATVRGRRLNYSKLSQFLSVPFFQVSFTLCTWPNEHHIMYASAFEKRKLCMASFNVDETQVLHLKKMLVSFWFAEKMKR